MKKLLALILVLVLSSFALPVLAEGADAPSDNFLDMQVKIGNKIYTLAGPRSILADQGLTHTRPDNVRVGYWQEVSNGRVAFNVLLDALHRDETKPEDAMLCGYMLERKNLISAVLPGGLDVMTATRADVRATYGEPENSYNETYDYYFSHRYVRIHFRFEEDNDASLIRDVEVSSSAPYSFSGPFAPATEQTDLPDPSTMTFNQFILDGHLYDVANLTAADLTANGWVLDAGDAERQIEPYTGGFIISGMEATYYNGRGFAQTFLYNPGSDGNGKNIPASEATALSVSVNQAYNTSMVLADGLTFGATLTDITATYGTNYKEEVKEGYTAYIFEMANTWTTFHINSEGVVYYISLRTY